MQRFESDLAQYGEEQERHEYRERYSQCQVSPCVRAKEPVGEWRDHRKAEVVAGRPVPEAD